MGVNAELKIFNSNQLIHCEAIKAIKQERMSEGCDDGQKTFNGSWKSSFQLRKQNEWISFDFPVNSFMN